MEPSATNAHGELTVYRVTWRYLALWVNVRPDDGLELYGTGDTNRLNDEEKLALVDGWDPLLLLSLN